MFRKVAYKFSPLLQQCQKRNIFMAITNAGRSRNRQNPYSSVLKDDMLNLTPDEIQQEITFLSNMPLQGITDRQNLAEMDIKLLMKKRKFKNIERKYFSKEPEPCFLTCSMKEQIRILHMSDSNLWTPVNLSYVFPATLPEIKKLIKDKPSNLSEENIKSHDNNVLENWKRFSKGQLGSIALLKKTIATRFSEVSETKQLVATLGSNQEVNNFLDSLKFTEDDDEIAIQDAKSKNHLKKLYKKSYPFKETFKDIITNYDNDLAKVRALESSTEKESETQNEIKQCTNLREILPVYKKDISESYIKVNSGRDDDNGIKSYEPNSLSSNSVNDRVPAAKNMTYEDFTNFKDNHNDKSVDISNLLKKGDLEEALILAKELLSTKTTISTATIYLLLQHLSESGDYTNIEFIGNQLSEEMRTKTKVLNQLVFAYQKMGKTNIFINRVLNHIRGQCKETLVTFIPSLALPNILIKEPQLEASVKECARVEFAGGHTKIMAGLLNAYLILIELKKAEEIYSEYFENKTFFNISAVCHQSYLDSNYHALNFILELVNRRPAGREKMKAFIYSTLIDLLCKENKFEEANEVFKNLSLQNLERKHIRRSVIENLKHKMKKSGLTFSYDISS